MPKSKNRKNQKEKSQERTLMMKRHKEKAQREFMDMIRGMQQKQYDEQELQENPNIVGVDELGDIGDFQIDTEPVEVETAEPVETKE